MIGRLAHRARHEWRQREIDNFEVFCLTQSSRLLRTLFGGEMLPMTSYDTWDTAPQVGLKRPNRDQGHLRVKDLTLEEHRR